MDYKNVVGLSKNEVIKSRKEHGNNEISVVKKEGFLKMLLLTLGDPIIKILLIALGIKTVFLFKSFDWFETIGILAAIMLASFISTISEYGSEKAFDKLQEESSKIKTKVRRNNLTMEIDLADVVVKDIIILSPGDRIPADGVVIKGEISVDESSLTGESKEIPKKNRDKVYRGSVVCAKNALIKVTLVGDQTFYGRISKEVQEKSPDSPLKLRLLHLAKIISKIGYVGAFLGAFSYLFAVIFIRNNYDISLAFNIITNWNVFSSHLLYALTLVVTIIIVCVPEGLPMMITLVLSSNMKRMLKNNVLVRKLVGIETAGSLNVLCFDKTGTITKGKPVVTGILDGNCNFYNSKNKILKEPFSNILLLSLTVNNESMFDPNGNIVGGNITDKAILSFIEKEDISAKVIKSIPFDSKYKYSKVVIDNNGKKLVLIKGAPEILFPYCNYYYDKQGNKKTLMQKYKLNMEIDNYVKKSARVLAVVTSDVDSSDHKFNDLTLVGFIIIKDEIRADAATTISKVQNAGIKTIMITGDNLETASSIAKEVGVINYSSDICLTSEKLNQMSDEEVRKIFLNLKVVARALPTDKSRLIKIGQSLNFVVGMTGDGVNDAPALKKADVGFAMGSGTEVAKEASDIIIIDDNIKSISMAILYGRTIFKSIRKFIIFQLSLNICALLVSIVSPIFGIEAPITVIQMLWINMIMDTLAAFAFSYEPPLLEYMKELPKAKDEPVLNRYMISEIILAGLYSSTLCIAFLKLSFFHKFFRYSAENEYLMTAFFGLFIFTGIFNSFNARTFRVNVLSNLFKNKVFLGVFIAIIIIQLILIYHGGDIFRTYGLNLKELQIMLTLAFSIIPVDFLRKIYLRLRGRIEGV